MPKRIPSKPAAVVRAVAALTDVVSGENRSLTFTISTPTPDRERDSIDANGWKLDNYRKNPVVLWAHDYRQPPIARAVDIHVEGGKLVATAEFVPADVSPFAESIYQMVKRGFLSGTSVGFRPIKSTRNDERLGYDFLEQELLEFSITPVPANAEALVMARSAGVDVEPMRAWAKAVMDELPEQLTLDATDAEDAETVNKSGRVLSGKNEAALKAAMDAIDSALTKLHEVMSQLQKPDDMDEDEDAGKSAVAAVAKTLAHAVRDAVRTVEAPAPYFVLLDETVPEWSFALTEPAAPAAEKYTIDAAALSGALAAQVSTVVAAAVDARVSATLRALRGRLD